MPPPPHGTKQAKKGSSIYIVIVGLKKLKSTIKGHHIVLCVSIILDPAFESYLHTLEPYIEIQFYFRPFNREKNAQYSFEVFAIDQGLYGPRSQNIRVDVDILDINDNAPIFQVYPYQANISQSHSSDTFVLQVEFLNKQKKFVSE